MNMPDELCGKMLWDASGGACYLFIDAHPVPSHGNDVAAGAIVQAAGATVLQS